MNLGADEKRVKDVMHPLGDFPRVGRKTRLRDAVRILKESGYPAVDVLLVTSNGDSGGGQIEGYLTPRRIVWGLDPEFFQQDEAPVLWSGLFNELCERGLNKEAAEVMVPLEGTVHKNASLVKALYLMDSLGARRLAVSDGQDVVGILCLSDIYAQIEEISARGRSS
jgi:predicted transcriptional regulator